MEKDTAALTALSQWYTTCVAGKQAAHLLDEHIEPIIARFFGYHCLQIGLGAEPNCLTHSVIPHKIVQSLQCEPGSGLLSTESQLPYPDASMDLIVVPHTLELTQRPDALLQELHRILIPSGHILFVGFNPLSLSGVSSLYYRLRRRAWVGRWRTPLGLGTLLEDHGFRVETYASFFYRPLIANKTWLNRLLFIETFGQFTSILPGGMYIATVRKHVPTVTPIRALFTFRRFVIGRVIPDLSPVHHQDAHMNVHALPIDGRSHNGSRS